MKYNVKILNNCKKDIKRAKKQGKDITLLAKVVDQLSEGKILDPKYRDHKLHGEYEGKRECHIQPDFLLIYEINNEDIILYLVRVGTHALLFKL